MHKYESRHRAFPTSKCKGDTTGPSFSWRVALLPYLDHKDLYDQYNFEEPWDSETNSKVMKQMPDVFRHPSSPDDSTETGYLGIAGKRGVFGAEKPKGFEHIRDGSSNTICIIESKSGIPWTKPEDLLLDSLQWVSKEQFKKAFSEIQFFDKDAICVGTADGSASILDGVKLRADVKKANDKAPVWLGLFTVDEGILVYPSDYSLKPGTPPSVGSK